MKQLKEKIEQWQEDTLVSLWVEEDSWLDEVITNMIEKKHPKSEWELEKWRVMAQAEIDSDAKDNMTFKAWYYSALVDMKKYLIDNR